MRPRGAPELIVLEKLVWLRDDLSGATGPAFVRRAGEETRRSPVAVLTPNPNTPPTANTPAEASFIASVTANFGPQQGNFAQFIVSEVHIAADFATLAKDIPTGAGVNQADFNQLFADTSAALNDINNSGTNTDTSQVWKAQVISYSALNQYVYGAASGFNTAYSGVLLSDAANTAQSMYHMSV